MTASRLKRLGKLEDRKRKDLEGITSRALERLTPEQLEGVGWHLERQDTPEGKAAVSRLIAWGEAVPEIREAPELGKAAEAWRKRLEAPGAFLPPASMEAAEQFERYAVQWEDVAARPDCPEPEAARGMFGAWSFWAALARESRGDPEPF